MANTVFGIKLENKGMSWLLVGGLGAVLVGVILFGGGDAAEDPAAQATTAQDSPTAGGDEAPAGANPRRRGQPAKQNTTRKTRELPPLDPAEAMKHNPFTLSEAAAEQLSLESGKAKDAPTEEELAAMERNKRRDQVLDELRRTRVSMVFRSSDGNAAVIGNRTLREGDTIDGVRVISITNTGITVEPID